MQLHGRLAEIRGRGAELAFVGSGRPHQAARFRESRELTCPVLTDPGRASYRAAGLRRGVLASLGPSALANGLRTLGGGFRQHRLAGDPWQQGGTFVIAPGGELLFAHRDRVGGDHPDPDAVLAALP